MFDIGFFEIIIIALIGLVVIGPQRLPEALRTGAMLIGRGKRMMGNMRRDIENEIGIDEIRRDLYNEAIMNEIRAEKDQEENMDTLEPQQTPDSPSNSNTQTQQNMEPLNNETALPQVETKKNRFKSNKTPHINNYLDNANQNGNGNGNGSQPSSNHTPVQATISKSKE